MEGKQYFSFFIYLFQFKGKKKNYKPVHVWNFKIYNFCVYDCYNFKESSFLLLSHIFGCVNYDVRRIEEANRGEKVEKVEVSKEL